MKKFLFFVLVLLLSIFTTNLWLASENEFDEKNLSTYLPIVKITSVNIRSKTTEGQTTFVESNIAEETNTGFLYIRSSGEPIVILYSPPFVSSTLSPIISKNITKIEIILTSGEKPIQAELIGINELYSLAFFKFKDPDVKKIEPLKLKAPEIIRSGTELWIAKRSTTYPEYPIGLSKATIAYSVVRDNNVCYSVDEPVPSLSIVLNNSMEPLGLAFPPTIFAYESPIEGNVLILGYDTIEKMIGDSLNQAFQPWLGLNESNVLQITDELGSELNVPKDKENKFRKGLLIVSLEENSLLKKTGLNPYDILLEVGNVKLNGIDDLTKVLDEMKKLSIGKIIPIKYLKRTEKLSYAETSSFIPIIPKPKEEGYIGIKNMRQISADFAKDVVGLPYRKKGYIVLDTYPDSPVAKAGIKFGDIITKIGNIDLSSDGAETRLIKLPKLLEIGKKVTIEYLTKAKNNAYEKRTTEVIPLMKEKVVPTWLGLTAEDLVVLDKDLKEALDVSAETKGLLVVSARENFTPGDIILKIGNVDLRVDNEKDKVEQMKKLENQLKLGITTCVSLLKKERDTYEKKENVITWGEKKINTLTTLGSGTDWRQCIAYIPTHKTDKLNISRDKKGVILTCTPPENSPFGKAGLERGDIIYEMNGINLATEVEDEAMFRFDLLSNISADEKIIVKYLRRMKKENKKETDEEKPEYEDKTAEVQPINLDYEAPVWLGLTDDNWGVANFDDFPEFNLPKGKSGLRIIDYLTMGSSLVPRITTAPIMTSLMAPGTLESVSVSPGDIITQIGKYDLSNKSNSEIKNILKEIEKLPLGEKLMIKYYRRVSPVKYKLEIKNILTSKKTVRQVWFGFTSIAEELLPGQLRARIPGGLEDIKDEVMEALSIPKDKKGLRLANIPLFSPLIDSGLKVGDILLKIKELDLTKITAAEADKFIREIEAKATLKDELEITYLRKEGNEWKEINTKIKPIEQPIGLMETIGYKEYSIGVEVIPITKDVLSAFNITDAEQISGVVIKGILRGGGTTGFRGGEIIQKIGESETEMVEVKSVKDFIYLFDKLRQRKPTEIVVYYSIFGTGGQVGRGTRTKILTPDWKGEM